MNIAKKQYEISLWDEQLVWNRRGLEEVYPSKLDDNKKEEFSKKYVRGAYYVVNTAATYELDYEDFNSGKIYYQLKKIPKNGENEVGVFFETDNVKELDLESESGWEGVPNVISSYYKETRLFTIGSHSMDSLARCVNPKLVSKVNGENTLTFTMYYQYIDTETGEKIYNPFIKYMTNERKVKLKYDGKWYDFVIKQIQENSDTRAFTYTCKDQFINELSKTGFDLVLDNELENNMGTVVQLAETILEGSDWRLDKGNTQNLKQFIEEPLYKIQFTSDNYNTTDKLAPVLECMNPAEGQETLTGLRELEGQYIYVFYSHINDQVSDLQFLYTSEEKFSTDDKLVIDKYKYSNYLLKGVKFDDPDKNGNKWPSFTYRDNDLYDAALTSDYRGMRLVRQIQTKYDSTTDKFVQVYKDKSSDKIIYGYTETEYNTSSAVKNYIVNPSAFTSTTGWFSEGDSTLELVIDPPVEGNSFSSNRDFTSYLKFSSNGEHLVNSSFNGFKSSLKGFTETDEYVLRIKYKLPNAEDDNVPGSYKTGITIGKDFAAKVYDYDYSSDNSYVPKKKKTFDTEPQTGKIYYTYDEVKKIYNSYEQLSRFTEGVQYYEDIYYFDFETWDKKIGPKDNKITVIEDFKKEDFNENVENFIYLKAKCLETLSESKLQDLKTRLGLFLWFGSDSKVYIENIQLFPLITYERANTNYFAVPGGNLFSEIKTVYKYYEPSKEYTSIKDVNFIEKGENDVYELQYNEGADAYTKIINISAKESNRFNLLQELNEKFQCWSDFVIEHNDDGSITLGKDKNLLTGDEAYRQQKFVSFREYVGEENPVGFRYGINSKSIQRTLESNAIVSKLIVKDNANEFAESGFCSIARASENPSKENFILNFDYYVRQKLLNINVVTNDLYLDSNGYIGYYKKLKEWNRDRDEKINRQSKLLTDISEYESSYQTYKTSYDSAFEERQRLEDDIINLIVPSGGSYTSFDDAIQNYSNEWLEEKNYQNYTTKWAQCKNTEKQHEPLYKKAEEYRNQAEAEYKAITEWLEELANKKRALNLQFYKKYSRFIQEGSWIKEDYVDDNLYYLDSLSTLHTSSQPKVTYNIKVLDLSGLDEYKDYNYKLGDRTYIEDVEFFGYSLIAGQRNTPYREEIIVSEITRELDSPEKDSIKVQNFKTQFEDLFQRITAQTQQVEYHTGEYQRAASIVESNGTISTSTLANSFASNSLRLQNARDQSVVIDEYGITSTSLANPSEMIRIINGGIFMSTDGGQSWKTGLTGYGLNSSYMTAGQIDTDKILIKNGGDAAFRWDEKGLSAYHKNKDASGNVLSYNKNKFVRFDQNGIYGILANDEWDGTEEAIHANASFALTWSGFSLKNKYGEGYVSINSEKDIIVSDGVNDRIKIGALDKNLNPYVEYNFSEGEGFHENLTYYISTQSGTYQKTTDTTPQSNTTYYLYKPVLNYGIRIKDDQGFLVMETDSEGKLWLRDELHVGTSATNVKIGYLEEYKMIEGSEIHSVIQAGTSPEENGLPPFIVYEDGSLVANKVNITGGTIGGLNVTSVERMQYEVVITSETGLMVSDKSTIKLTAHLYHNGEEINKNNNNNGKSITYIWYKGNEIMQTGESNTYEVEIDFGENNYLQYSCKVQVEENLSGGE